MNHQTSPLLQIAYNSPQPSIQPLTEFPQMDSGLVVPVFNLGDDLIACLNKAMAFLTAVASSSYKGNATRSGGNNTGGQARVVKCYNFQGESHMARQCTQPKRPRNAAWFKEKAMLAEAQEAGQILDEEQLAFLANPGIPDGQAVQTTIPNTTIFQTEDLDAYDSDCDDVSNAKAVLMANLSSYGSDVLSKVPHSDSYHNDMDNQSVHAMQDFEQTPIEKSNQEKNNESVTAELERYKERVKTFEQRLNVDLSTREKMIDSQMDDMIKEKLALKQQIDSLEQNLSNQIKEKESLLQTFTIFKNESKEKENKYIDKEIDLEKKIKELDNIVYKVGQSAQTVHMLTKPQVFYDNAHKQALGYQNPFYLKKAQRIKPTLYDGSVISDKHVASPVFDDEETLILEELNRLSEDFGKRFVPQQELSDEQAFWLQTSHPNTDQSASSPVKIEAPRELPKYFIDKKCFEIQKKELFLENDRLLQKIMSQDVMICVMNSTAFFDDVNVEMQSSESCVKCVDLEAELLNKQKYFENNDLKAQLQAKDTTIWKGVENAAKIPVVTTVTPGMFKLDLDPLAPRLLQNRKAHIYYLKHTQEQANILWGIFEQAKAKQPIDNALDLACKNATGIQESLVYVRDTCPNAIKLSEKKVAIIPMNKVKQVRSQSTGNKKNDRISQKPSSNRKNKVEAQPRNVNIKNRVKEPICDDNVKHTMLNANSHLICVKCKQCMFDANHDVCFLDFVNDVNMHAKSKTKSKKSQVQNIWKPTGKVFIDVGFKWKPIGRRFTIVGNLCPLTRFTPNKIVPLKETTYNSVETPKTKIKAYSKRPKQIKSVSSSKKAKIVESKIANNSKPNHLWGSNATDVPSSSSLVNDRLSRLFAGTIRFGNDQVAKIMREVIMNGDAPAVASASFEAPIPPNTAEQKLARKNELKAKSTLLLAIPDEHLLKFHGIKDAKTLWEAIKTMFGGNKESKKMQRTILKQQYENFTASRFEGLNKTYDRA
ncbi:hypothetical protein Tco_0523719 [Tanacetum coccineum]